MQKGILISLFLVCALAVVMAGCTGNSQNSEEKTVVATITSQTSQPTTTATVVLATPVREVTTTPKQTVNAEKLFPKNTQGWLNGSGLDQNTKGEWLDTPIEYLFPKTWSSTGLGLHSPDSSTNILIEAIPSDGWDPKDSIDRGYISNDDFGAIVKTVIPPTSGFSNITPDPNYYLINGKPARMFSADGSVSSGYNQVMRDTGLPEKNVPMSVTGYTIIVDTKTSVLGIIESDTRRSEASDIETGKDIVKTISE
jgi:hypothetical protein